MECMFLQSSRLGGSEAGVLEVNLSRRSCSVVDRASLLKHVIFRGSVSAGDKADFAALCICWEGLYYDCLLGLVESTSIWWRLFSVYFVLFDSTGSAKDYIILHDMSTAISRIHGRLPSPLHMQPIPIPILLPQTSSP